MSARRAESETSCNDKRHVKIKMSGYKRNPGRPASKTVKSKEKKERRDVLK